MLIAFDKKICSNIERTYKKDKNLLKSHPTSDIVNIGGSAFNLYLYIRDAS